MERILERYERCRHTERAVLINESEPQEDLRHEYGYLKSSKVDGLQRSRSHLSGEKLGTLSLKELQQLEQQFETSLKHIRSQMKKSLLEQKIVLEKKIIESENSIKMLQQMSAANEQSQAQASSSSSPPTIDIGTFGLQWWPG